MGLPALRLLVGKMPAMLMEAHDAGQLTFFNTRDCEMTVIPNRAHDLKSMPRNTYF